MNPLHAITLALISVGIGGGALLAAALYLGKGLQ